MCHISINQIHGCLKKCLIEGEKHLQFDHGGGVGEGNPGIQNDKQYDPNFVNQFYLSIHPSSLNLPRGYMPRKMPGSK